jgi:hypothetical protein
VLKDERVKCNLFSDCPAIKRWGRGKGGIERIVAKCEQLVTLGEEYDELSLCLKFFKIKG